MPKKKKTESASDVEVRGVDLNEVRRLLDFMAQHGLQEFEYETKEFHVRLRKTSPQGEAFRPSTVSEHAPAAHQQGSSASPPSQASAPASAPSPASAVPDDVHIVKSPIVGTFYAAPNPGADPFTKIGAKVDEGTVLAIIEAMKLMNEIESDVAGEVVQIFAENGSPVEYGEPLFGIRTSRKK
jgi:acetyl-CoA carboxylase biotin carboxyl carrier protein